MKKITVISIVVQIWITLQFVSCAPKPRGSHGEPLIDPPVSSIVIDANTDRKIECKAKYPVTWISEIPHDTDSNVSINDDQVYEDHENPYRSYLDFTTINVNHVGRYYCIYEYMKEDDRTNYDKEVKRFKASTIYVFVNDPVDLLVEPKDHEVMIIGQQHKPFVIPCKPTSPNIKVELINEQGEVITETELLTVIDRNPEYGFTVVANESYDSEFVNCEAQESGKSQLFTITVDKALSGYLPPPEITSSTQFFAMDKTEVFFTCNVNLDDNTMYDVYFVRNDKRLETNDYLTVSELQHEINDTKKSHKNLTIAEADKERDEGDYSCMIIDHYGNTNSVTKTLTFVDEPMVKLKPDNSEIKTRKSKKQAKFNINYEAYPDATFYIFNPKDEQISANNSVMRHEKYKVEILSDVIEFAVKYPDIHDFGTYTILASSVGKNFTTSVRLVVSEKPTVDIDDAYVLLGESVNMTCRVIAYPEATITWGFMACSDLSLWPDCGRNRPANDTKLFDEVGSAEQTVESQSLSEITQVSPINFTPTEPGHIGCRARNTVGTVTAIGSVKVGDLKEPFMIWGIDQEKQEIAEGDTVRLECGAIIYNHSDKIVWRKDGEELIESHRIRFDSPNTKFSYRKSLIWDNIAMEDSGTYECEVYRRDTEEYAASRIIQIEVHPSSPPSIIPNFNQTQISLPMGENLQLDCLLKGLPTPTISWYKNDEPFKVEENDLDENQRQRVIQNDDFSITFYFLKPEDSGVYKCHAENRLGADEKQVELIVESVKTPLNRGILVGVISAFLIFVCILIMLCMKVRHDKKRIAELKAAGLANFEEGNVESIDPDVNLDEQADLLPYNRDVEFPRDKLKLGKMLGAGAFGVVVKATATGILPYEEESTVAVKMVKKQTDNDVMKALVSELKIMIHLGQHLNVVNLLGAVTKNIAKRELMVIVEYCQFGNLQSFLVKHRPYFIDQIRKDKIDQSIYTNEMRWSNNSAYQIQSQGLKYIELMFVNNNKSDKIRSNKKNSYINVDANHYINVISDGNNYPAFAPRGGQGLISSNLNTAGYVQRNSQHPLDSCNTEATMLNSAEEDPMLSNNSEQPLWRTSYGMDYKGPARPVCTSDLVCWAFQIARGMDYLSSRKVLHGDLAARNVLLCDNNVVKICDFGLARSMYKSENYKKKTETPLPFKWLALESISDHVFSTYSDVWAFGVVLWELFSLGKVPYTGMEANENLYYKLRDGYRMDKPMFSTTDIYDIMLNCWNKEPKTRPLFNELEKRLGKFLHESVKDHYIDLNEPYMTSNLDYMKTRPDYLSQFSAPVDEAPKPPLAEEENFYVNDPINGNENLNTNSPNYLAMSPKSGTVRYQPDQQMKKSDSPTLARNLDSSPKRKYDAKIPEEIPMLRKDENGIKKLSTDSDEDELQNGYTEMSFDHPPIQPRSRESHDFEYTNVFKPSENYVNVPASSTISNPSYITFKNEKKH